ncbi:MAG TPA: major facilitator superfamily domain-containing protein 6 [Roseiflexaceae bacterium]|nr:major facilitator superfamily domain-containing protein 6 [Roseiflexaceae bacterium]
MTSFSRLPAAKIFYFCWFGALGAYLPFIGLYYRERGLGLEQIGVLVALPGLLQLVSAPLWGLLADALRVGRLLLPLAIGGTLLPVLLIGTQADFGVLVLLVALQSLMSAPVIPLADSATIRLLGSNRERYGAQRLWGSVGWGISTVLFGRLTGEAGLTAIFAGYALLAGLAAAAAVALPKADLPQVDLRHAASTLLRDRRWRLFLGCMLLVGYGSATISSFLSLYLQDLGASGEQIGLAFTLAGLSELPVMALSAQLLRRWGPRPLLVCAGICFALRMLIYIAAPAPEWALAAQLMHGLCFGLLWIAGVVEAHRLAPPGLEATAQSLFGVAVSGVAAALASAAGGQIYAVYGTAALFSCGIAAALSGALWYGLAAQEQRTKQGEPTGS